MSAAFCISVELFANLRCWTRISSSRAKNFSFAGLTSRIYPIYVDAKTNERIKIFNSRALKCLIMFGIHLGGYLKIRDLHVEDLPLGGEFQINGPEQSGLDEILLKIMYAGAGSRVTMDDEVPPLIKIQGLKRY